MQALDAARGIQPHAKLFFPGFVQFKQKLDAEELYRILYGYGFPSWFVSHAKVAYVFDWDRIVPVLDSGEFCFAAKGNILGKENLSRSEAQEHGRTVIRKLAALVAVSMDKDSQVRRSLELDGFSVDEQKIELTPLEGPVSHQKEEDSFVKLLKSAKLPNEVVILKHLFDASDLFRLGKDHAAIGEARSFLEAIVDSVAEQTHKLGGHSVGLPGGFSNRAEYLRATGFFTEDEKKYFLAAWGALCAGSHPGVPAKQEARIGLVLSIEFGQLLAAKYENWRANGCRKFG